MRYYIYLLTNRPEKIPRQSTIWTILQLHVYASRSRRIGFSDLGTKYIILPVRKDHVILCALRMWTQNNIYVVLEWSSAKHTQHFIIKNSLFLSKYSAGRACVNHSLYLTYRHRNWQNLETQTSKNENCLKWRWRKRPKNRATAAVVTGCDLSLVLTEIPRKVLETFPLSSVTFLPFVKKMVIPLKKRRFHVCKYDLC